MRLLLAEDEQELSKALVAILEHNRYSVDAVYDGEDALDYARSGGYDGVILDVMMPKRSGLSVLRQLREEGSSVPILLLTARAEIDDRIEGLDAGADDYLTKPFAMGELLARIRAMLRRREDFQPDDLRFGNLQLNRRRFSAVVGSQSARLSNKEYQIMELLITSPRTVIPTDQIMEKIWGWDSNADINVVWVYISNLRKKLAAIGADVEIRVTRGVGYSLEQSDGGGEEP